MNDDHGREHFAAGYRDVVTLINAARSGDEGRMCSVKQTTACRECLLEGLAFVAARLGDGRATQRAAQMRLDSLCEEVDWAPIDLEHP